MLGAGISPTLELARERMLALPAPPRPAPVADVRIDTRAIGIALAIAISWLAAGALVVGLTWFASTLERSGQIPPETWPYSLAWSGAAVAALATSVASLFLPARRVALLATAALVAAGMVAATVAANALT
jgi:hypothetical protein